MMNKINNNWKDVSFFPNYRVNEDGVVQNKITGRYLKACDNDSGYPTVNLYNNGNKVTKSIHCLVAETFNGKGFDGTEVNHEDGNKHNNNKNNLTYCTSGENKKHSYRTGLRYGPKHKPVRICETNEVYPSIKECARSIKGNERNIKKCLDNEQKTYRGLTFEYAEKMM